MDFINAVVSDQSDKVREYLSNLDSHFGIRVSINGNVVLSKFQGNVPNTRFRLFSSLSKPVTALAVLLLVQDGKLKLTTRVERARTRRSGGCDNLGLDDARLPLV